MSAGVLEVIMPVDQQMNAAGALIGNISIMGGGVVLFMGLLVIVVAVRQRIGAKKTRVLLDFVETAASGDLSHSVDMNGTDEYAQIGEALNRWNQRLESAATDLNNQVDSLRRSYDELRESGRSMDSFATRSYADMQMLTQSAEQVSSNTESSLWSND